MSSAAAGSSAPARAPHRLAITLSVMLASILQSLDNTIANVALPRIPSGSRAGASSLTSAAAGRTIVPFKVRVTRPSAISLTGRPGIGRSETPAANSSPRGRSIPLDPRTYKAGLNFVPGARK